MNVILSNPSERMSFRFNIKLQKTMSEIPMGDADSSIMANTQKKLESKNDIGQNLGTISPAQKSLP
jgi:hypothetical protein